MGAGHTNGWQQLIRKDSADNKENGDATKGLAKRKEYAYQSTFQLGQFRAQHGDMGSLLAKNLNKVGSSSVEQRYAPAEKEKERRRCLSWASISLFYDQVLEDWLYLALLGLVMAVCSLMMDMAIEHLQGWHYDSYQYATSLESASQWVGSYSVWVLYVVGCVGASALFAHYVAPQAIGSGIPEMKTILRGVILKEYLTLRTLVSKMVGLTLSLGSGLPIGKEGPFVHVASVVANLLSKFVHGADAIYQNESRSSEMLAAGCAVGVACTFSAPVGGVLFSIEVTSVYFAVRNYWRGFFAATCSATAFRIMRVALSAEAVTVSAYFQTDFPSEAFYPIELPVFAFIGLVCGFGGALFILLHRSMVLFLRTNSLTKFIQKNWILYPLMVAFTISSLTFPKGFGIFLGGEKKFGGTLNDFFMNCTWSVPANHTSYCNDEQQLALQGWRRGSDDIHDNYLLQLAVFQATFFVLTIVASTLPIPAGIFMPVFVLGAAFGRTVGELMAMTFPEGLADPHNGGFHIHPGVYAVVGSAAFCGSVTHTVSVAVIVFELTGQLLHILPVMIAVLIANAVCSYLQPSIYDSIIRMKSLPYLPNLPHTSSVFHRIRVEQFMVSPVAFVSRDFTYRELQDVVLDMDMPRLRAYPVVESKESMVLLGSISRKHLEQVVDEKLGMRARQAEATRRVRSAIEEVDKRFQLAKAAAEQTGIGQKRDRFTVVPVAKKEDEKLSKKDKKKASMEILSPKFGLTDDQKEAIFAMGVKRGTPTGDEKREKEQTAEQREEEKEKAAYSTISGVFRSITRSFHRHPKHTTKENDFDLRDNEREEWEAVMLAETVDLSTVPMDPAPFQLVEHTSLVKVHSLFSLLGLRRAYVTSCGRLCGVVALCDLRVALTLAHSGELLPGGEAIDRTGTGDETDDEYEDNFQPRPEIVKRDGSSEALVPMEEGLLPKRKLSFCLPPSIKISSLRSPRKISDVSIDSTQSSQCSDVPKEVVRKVTLATLSESASDPNLLRSQQRSPRLQRQESIDERDCPSASTDCDISQSTMSSRTGTPEGILLRTTPSSSASGDERPKSRTSKHVTIRMPDETDDCPDWNFDDESDC